MLTNVSILVFVGDPLDYIQYRHTALFLEFPEGSTCLMDVEGAAGFFQFQALDNCNPEQGRQLAKKIPVAGLQNNFDEASLRRVISRTPVKNDCMDADWNCQNWVADALSRMVSSGYLNASQRASAIDRMTDVLLEARDE